MSGGIGTGDNGIKSESKMTHPATSDAQGALHRELEAWALCMKFLQTLMRFEISYCLMLIELTARKNE